MLKIHELFENWLVEADAGALSTWKASLTLSHLKRCARCRAFASNLLLSLDDSGTAPGGAWSDKDAAPMLHARIMAAYHRERGLGRHARLAAVASQNRFGVTPRFVKAMGVVALGLGLLVMLARPFQNSRQDASVAATPKRSLDLPKPAAPVTAQPSDTPSITPSATTTPTPTPTPQSKL